MSWRPWQVDVSQTAGEMDRRKRNVLTNTTTSIPRAAPHMPTSTDMVLEFIWVLLQD
jgi:hypothetical protein